MHIGFGLGLWQQGVASGSGGPFSPANLFAAGEQGVWYDPSDMATLFQDSAGTIPVTAAGQPVGRMLDKSGRGNHATQATATKRPILQTTGGLWYLAFDGADDFMQTGNVNFTTTNKMTVFGGVTKASEPDGGPIVELSANPVSSNGSFGLWGPSGPGAADYSSYARGTAYINNARRTGFPAPHTAVLTLQIDFATPVMSLRVNTAMGNPDTTSPGTGNFGNYPIYLGKRGGTVGAFSGKMFGLIVRGAKSTDSELNATETWLNAKTGAYTVVTPITNVPDLFKAGEQGVWYDPSDMATLFQDSAGTIPVTGAGQPVGRMLDKSGRGNHATQATATKRPILQTSAGKWYLAFDGIDDSMQTSAINFTTTNKVTVWCGELKASDAGATGAGVILEIGPSASANNGSFGVYGPSTTSAGDYLAISRGSSNQNFNCNGYPAPHTGVLCMQADIATSTLTMRVNQVFGVVGVGAAGSGNYGNWPLYLGQRGGTTLAFTGNMYEIIVRGAATDSATVTNIEALVNNKTGAY